MENTNKIKERNTRKEQRRIPLDSNFINGKEKSKVKPSDMLYGYLQMLSTTDSKDEYGESKQIDKRFVYKSDYKHTDVVEYFGKDLADKDLFPVKDVQRAFKLLKDLGFIKEDKIRGLKGNIVKIYELPYINDGAKYPYKLIPLDTLEYLLDGCNHNVIKLYAYILRGFDMYKFNFEFTDKLLLKEVFGFSSNTNARINKQLHNRLDVLKKLGLVSFYKYYKQLDNGHSMPVYKLIGVKYYIDRDDMAN